MIKKATSIRRFLLSAMIAALLIASTVAGVASWLASKKEMDEVYKANLVQVAKAIQAHHATLEATPLKEPTLIGTIKGPITVEEDFFVRIKDAHDHLLYISHPDVNLPSSETEGFSKVVYQHQKWRVFIIKSGNDKIEVAQSIKLRNQAVNEVARSLVLPQIIFIPIFGIFIWFIVGKSLYPLTVLSTSITKRPDGLFEPLSLEKIPFEIQPLVKALNDLLVRLRKMISISRQFTSDAAHELRTPLTALKLQLVNLERAKDDDQRNEAITQLDAGIERSISLVQQLLTLARMDPDSVELPFEPVILSGLVKSSIEEFLPFSTNKNIDLGITEKNNLEIMGNSFALKTLINNLIDNAIRYTPTNGRIDISIFEQDGRNVFKITDTGPGIPETEFHRVFDRFYRGPNNDNTTGTGLGLAIVKEIADHHKAVIALENAKDHAGLIIQVKFSVI